MFNLMILTTYTVIKKHLKITTALILDWELSIHTVD